MKIAKNSHVIICDDVRNEVGNKLSFMGIYPTGIVLPFVPNTLKGLHVIFLLDGIKKRFNKVRFILTIPGSNPFELFSDAPPEDHQKKTLQLVFGLAPLKIEKTGMARIKLYIDETLEPEVEYEFEIKLSSDVMAKPPEPGKR